jgi:hypothetical protein
MLSDFKLIVRKFPTDYDHINVYPVADAHIGAPEFSEHRFRKWSDTVIADERGYIAIAGDMLNNGLKNSKTNVYEETMRPAAQKDYLTDALSPLRDRILCGVGGNHEYRSVRESDTDPLYDVFCRLGIGELYRQNAAFLKLALGARRTNTKNPRQFAYTMAVAHGAGKHKTDRWTEAVEGVDAFITAHTHEARVTPPSKIRIDPHNETVLLQDYVHIVCNPLLDYGGYALRGMFTPKGSTRIQVLRLSGTAKEMQVTT